MIKDIKRVKNMINAIILGGCLIFSQHLMPVKITGPLVQQDRMPLMMSMFSRALESEPCADFITKDLAGGCGNVVVSFLKSYVQSNPRFQVIPREQLFSLGHFVFQRCSDLSRADNQIDCLRGNIELEILRSIFVTGPQSVRGTALNLETIHDFYTRIDRACVELSNFVLEEALVILEDLYRGYRDNPPAQENVIPTRDYSPVRVSLPHSCPNTPDRNESKATVDRIGSPVRVRLPQSCPNTPERQGLQTLDPNTSRRLHFGSRTASRASTPVPQAVSVEA